MINASKLRGLNIAKSKEAGVAVGEYSELSRPGVGKIPKSWRRKKSKKKGKQAGKKSKKDNAALKAERDALFGWRRLPGSFEGGRNR